MLDLPDLASLSQKCFVPSCRIFKEYFVFLLEGNDVWWDPLRLSTSLCHARGAQTTTPAVNAGGIFSPGTRIRQGKALQGGSWMFFRCRSKLQGPGDCLGWGKTAEPHYWLGPRWSHYLKWAHLGLSLYIKAKALLEVLGGWCFFGMCWEVEQESYAGPFLKGRMVSTITETWRREGWPFFVLKPFLNDLLNLVKTGEFTQLLPSLLKVLCPGSGLLWYGLIITLQNSSARNWKALGVLPVRYWGSPWEGLALILPQVGDLWHCCLGCFV